MWCRDRYLEPRAGAISIHSKFREWPEKFREEAVGNNIVLSKELDVLCELNNVIAADSKAVLIGYNMAGLDALAVHDAAVRSGTRLFFDLAFKQMDLYRSPIVRRLRNCFPKGAGHCRCDLRSIRRIIERATPGYFNDVVGNWHDAACDANVLRYNMLGSCQWV